MIRSSNACQRRLGITSRSLLTLTIASLGLLALGAAALGIDVRSGRPLSWETMGQSGQPEAMIEAATNAAARYQKVERARADGFLPVTGVLPGSAMHFVSQANLDDAGFDATRPEVLLYDDVAAGRLELVGVAYLLPQGAAAEAAPDEFGPLAHWHAHDFHWPCLTVRTEGSPVTIALGDVACRSEGGLIIPPRFWMLHAWFFRPSPDGVFSAENRTVQPLEMLVEGSLTRDGSGDGS